MAWVVSWLARMLLPFLNLFHLVRKSHHWAGEQPKSIVGRTKGVVYRAIQQLVWVGDGHMVDYGSY